MALPRVKTGFREERIDRLVLLRLPAELELDQDRAPLWPLERAPGSTQHLELGPIDVDLRVCGDGQAEALDEVIEADADHLRHARATRVEIGRDAMLGRAGAEQVKPEGEHL